MKVKSKRVSIQANKVFTDREIPRESFWKKYKQCEESIKKNEGEIIVLSYYGIGGIGKSTLLRKLIAEMEEEINKPSYVFFDFDVKHEEKEVLVSLRNILSEKYKFQFPLFDLALYNYSIKTGENVESPCVQAVVDKSPMLSSVLDIVQEIPTIGIIPKLITAADRGAAQVKNLIEKHKRNVYAIENDNVRELYERLPELFVLDLAEETDGLAEPLVIFFDTYEMLVNEMKAMGEPLLDDVWLRGENGLIQNIPNVLWVIAGREKLKWDKFDSNWNEALEQHILGSLSESDAIHFLESAGLGDEELNKQIYSLTQGTPVYLDLCVDRYISLLENNITPNISDFGNDVYSLIQRFARYIDNSQKDMVYILSCLKKWDDNLISFVLESGIGALSYSTYENVKEFSFITETSDNFYHIHQAVGDVLESDCPELLKQKVLRIAIEYYHDKMNRLSKNDYSYLNYICLLFEYGTKIVKEDEILSFFDKYINNAEQRLYESAYYDSAQEIVECLFKIGEIKQNGFIIARACVEQAELALSVNENVDDKVIVYINRALEFYKENLGEDSDDYISCFYLLCRADYLGRNPNVGIKDSNKGIELSIKKYGENSIETIHFKRNKARLYCYLKKYTKAFALVNEICSEQEKLQGKWHEDYLNTLRLKALILVYLKFYEEAIILTKDICSIAKNILGERHIEAIKTQCDLANFTRCLGNYLSAIELFDRALDLCIKYLGNEHQLTIITRIQASLNYYSLANQETNKDEEILYRKKGIELLTDSINRYLNIRPENDYIVDKYERLFWQYYKLEEYENAYEYAEKAHEYYWKDIESHFFDGISSIQYLILLNAKKGMVKEAISLGENILNVVENIDKPIKTKDIAKSRIKNTIAEALAESENEEDLVKALDLINSVLENYKYITEEYSKRYKSYVETKELILTKLNRIEEKEKLERELNIINEKIEINKQRDKARDMQEIGRLNEAYNLQKSLLDRSREKIGEDGYETLSLMGNFLWTKRQIAKNETEEQRIETCKNALNMYFEAIELYKKGDNKSKFTIPWMYENIYEVYYEMSEYDKSLEYAQKTYDLFVDEYFNRAINALAYILSIKSKMVPYDEYLEEENKILINIDEISKPLEEKEKGKINLHFRLAKLFFDDNKIEEARMEAIIAYEKSTQMEGEYSDKSFEIKDFLNQL